MNKEQTLRKRTQLQFLSKAKVAINFQIQGLALDKDKMEEEEFTKQFTQLIEKLHAVETEDTKLRRNKNGSTFYSYVPNVGLNRRQRRN